MNFALIQCKFDSARNEFTTVHDTRKQQSESFLHRARTQSSVSLLSGDLSPKAERTLAPNVTPGASHHREEALLQSLATREEQPKFFGPIAIYSLSLSPDGRAAFDCSKTGLRRIVLIVKALINKSQVYLTYNKHQQFHPDSAPGRFDGPSKILKFPHLMSKAHEESILKVVLMYGWAIGELIMRNSLECDHLEAGIVSSNIGQEMSRECRVGYHQFL